MVNRAGAFPIFVKEAAAADSELERTMHLAALAPTITPANVDYHIQVFRESITPLKMKIRSPKCTLDS